MDWFCWSGGGKVGGWLHNNFGRFNTTTVFQGLAKYLLERLAIGNLRFYHVFCLSVWVTGFEAIQDFTISRLSRVSRFPGCPGFPRFSRLPRFSGVSRISQGLKGFKVTSSVHDWSRYFSVKRQSMEEVMSSRTVQADKPVPLLVNISPRNLLTPNQSAITLKLSPHFSHVTRPLVTLLTTRSSPKSPATHPQS